MSAGLIDRIDAVLKDRMLPEHAFFVALERGSLPLASLRAYAARFYHFELAYPAILAGLHRRCTVQRFRQLMLDRLWAESREDGMHVGLWLDLCEALGLDRDGLRASEPSEPTARLVAALRALSDRESVIGASALYVYESQAPLVAALMSDALAARYGIDGRSLSFFDVHRPLDEEFRVTVRDLVTAQSGEEAGDRALKAADLASAALWGFPDDLV